MASLHTNKSIISGFHRQRHSSTDHLQSHQTREEAIDVSSGCISAASLAYDSLKDSTATFSDSLPKYTPKLMEQSTVITPLTELEARIKSLRPVSSIMKFEYAAAPYGKPAPASGPMENYKSWSKSPIKSTRSISTVSAAVEGDFKPVGCKVLFFDDRNGCQLKLDHETEIHSLVNDVYKANGPNRFSETVFKFHKKFMYLVFGMRGNDKEWKKIHEALQKDGLSVKWILFEDGVLSFGLSFIGCLTRTAAYKHVTPPNKEKDILNECSEQISHVVTITVPPNLTVRPVAGAHKLGRRLYETTVDDGSSLDVINPDPANLPAIQTKNHRRKRGKKAPKALLHRLLSTLHEDEKRVAAGKDRKGFKLPIDVGADGTQGDLPGDHPSYTDLDIFADELPTPASWLTKSRRALRKVMAGIGEKMADRAQRVRVSRSGHRLNSSRTQQKEKQVIKSSTTLQYSIPATPLPQPRDQIVPLPMLSVAQSPPAIPSRSITTQSTAKAHPAIHLQGDKVQNMASASTDPTAPAKAVTHSSQNESKFRRTSPPAPNTSSQPGQRKSPAQSANSKLSTKQSSPTGKALDLKSGSPQRIKRDPCATKRVPLAELKDIKLQKSCAVKAPIKALQKVEGMKQTSANARKTDSLMSHSSTITKITPTSTITKKIHVNARVAPETTTVLFTPTHQRSVKAVSPTTSSKEVPFFEEQERTSRSTANKNISRVIPVTKNIPRFPKDCPENKVQGKSSPANHSRAKSINGTIEKSTSTKHIMKYHNQSSKTPNRGQEKSPMQDAGYNMITRQVGMGKKSIVNSAASRKQPDDPGSPTPRRRSYNTGSLPQTSEYGRSNFGIF